jgi:hypothetical protein
VRLPAAASGQLEFAYPGDSQVPCIRRVGAGRMLCRRPLVVGKAPGFVPTIQPVDPERVCVRCVLALVRLLARCPVCDAEVVADGRGRAPEHGDCIGVNLLARRPV